MKSVPCPKCEGRGSVPSWPDPVRCDWCNGRKFEWAVESKCEKCGAKCEECE